MMHYYNLYHFTIVIAVHMTIKIISYPSIKSLSPTHFLFQMSIAFNGAAGAPLVGIFILGAFFPWANAKVS